LSDEIEVWKLRDPIERVRVHLVRDHNVEQSYFDEVQAEADAFAAEVREFCFNMPDPPPERTFANVYAEPSPVVDAQRDEYLAYLSGFDGPAHGSGHGSHGGRH
jgi:pyruvate dehydrogenase E1 component alpha subunit